MNPLDLSSLCARIAREPSLWGSLARDEQRALALHLRDRFFALSSRAEILEERALLREAIHAIDAAPIAHIEGLSISFHPTARHQAVRFVDATHIDALHLPLFARPSTQMPELVAVFVDPRELSFRTFENIVPLDRLLERTPLTLSLRDWTQVGERRAVYTCTLVPSEATRTVLTGLDALDLYVPPLDAASRGGLRFIFHSATLGEALTVALRESLPEALLEDFSHVNPVFRCNRFEPGDEGFHRHIDSPYSDPNRHHLSRYTLLLYLTGGSADPALRIEDIALQSLAPMTAVLFDQRYAHEGAPYREGRKVFLRTELVFTDDSVVYEPGIAQIFSRACYLTGESLFAPELARHARDCYDRAARAHWMGLQASGAPTVPFVHKEFRGVHFLANGYDSWFPTGVIPLESCAVLALLDFFNAVFQSSAFRLSCTSEVVEANTEDPGFIARFLSRFRTPLEEPLFTELRTDLLLPPPERDDGGGCPGCRDDFDASRNEDVREAYQGTRFIAEERLAQAPVLLMGQEVFLDKTRFVIERDKIHVLSRDALAPVNFAAHQCWRGESPEDYLAIEARLQAWQPLVPPLLFAETAGCFHLMFDFFRNGWWVGGEPETVEVYRIASGAHEGRR